MSFEGSKIMLVGLATFELPDYTIRLCDGGFIYFGGEKYTSTDPDFGSIEKVEAIEETTGDSAPAGSLTFLPASTAAAATLSNPSYQGSLITFTIASVDEQTGTIIETETVAEWDLDTTALRGGKGQRRLDIGMVSVADRFFFRNEGNVLSSRFHESIWPGENGFDNAISTPLNKAWGIQSPPRGSSFVGGGGYGGGAGGTDGGFARYVYDRLVEP